MAATLTPDIEQVEQKTTKPSPWTVHNVSLKLHLWLGLASAAFLLILGVTGAIMAFEGYVDHWLHPGLWYVKSSGAMRPQAEVVQTVEQRFAPDRVRMLNLPRHSWLAEVVIIAAPGAKPDLRNQHQVFVNPYTGAILGDRTGETRAQKVMAAIHQFHLKMAMGDTGVLILSIASTVLVFETIFGLVLWWRLKRATIKRGASWFRVCFDLHNVLGIYTALFVLLAAFTGVVIGFEFMEPLIFKLTKSERLVQKRPPKSALVNGATPLTPDQAIAVARQAMPEATVAGVQLPTSPTSVFNVSMRVPEETSEAVHSNVWIDQYNGQVLRTQNFGTDSLGYRVIRFNRSLHTGDVLGWPTHILMSLTSAALAVMVVTGVVIWWKKLAV